MPHKDIEVRRAYDRARKREWYEGLSGLEYNRVLLRRRRTKALSRRNLRTEEGT